MSVRILDLGTTAIVRVWFLSKALEASLSDPAPGTVLDGMDGVLRSAPDGIDCGRKIKATCMLQYVLWDTFWEDGGRWECKSVHRPEIKLSNL